MRALAPAVAVRTGALVGLAATGWLVSAADDSPDANIGLGIVLLGLLVLAVVVWGAVDGLRSVRRRRPDRDGGAVAYGLARSTAEARGRR